MLRRLTTLILLLSAGLIGADQRQLKVMMIFAHPDEGEIYTGGAAILYSQMGHKVKFLSLTNGDAGHYEMKPEDLAKRRYKEAMEAKRIMGLAEYEVFDYHDGKLTDTPEIREKVAAQIRDFRPDVVFSYYPAIGGHRDNMAAGWIVRGAAASVKMEKMPVFFYVRDYFTSRLSHVPHVAIAIDKVWETKLQGCGAHESQVLEANPKALGILAEVQASKEKARQYLYENTYAFSEPTLDIRLTLAKWYGSEAAKKVKYAEAFEIAEFGRQIREDEVRQLMPMIGHVITVSGKTRWLDTGVDLTRNKPIEMSAEGEIQWNVVGHEMCGPDGAFPYTRRGNKSIQGVNTGALIGKIGADSPDHFYIGRGGKFMPFATGRLFVGINDDNVRDNGGAFWLRFPAAVE